MVLRALLFLGVFFSLGCERIPEWERRPENKSSQGEWEALNALRPWLWTCRGKQVQYRLGDAGGLVGLEIESFLDQFRASGLSVVDTTGLKTIMGSALLWDDSGHLLTLYNWVEQTSEIECRNEFSAWKEVKLVGEDRPLNLSLLKADLSDSEKSFRSRSKWRAAEAAIAYDETLYAVSSPLAGTLDRMPIYPQTFRQSLHTGVDDSLLILHPAPPALFRGGLVVNSKAEVLGYLFQKSSEAWAAALKIDSLAKLVESMISGGKISRAHLGMRVRFVRDRGFVVQEVEVGGPAYKAGLRVQDQITSWNNKALSQFSDWPVINFKDIGQRIPIVYQHEGKSIETEFEIGSSY